jgi:hypothetical protein
MFLPSEEDRSAVAATLARMSGIFLNWTELQDSAGTVIVVTVRRMRDLPAQWRRRVQWHVELPEPRGQGLAEYRQAVFAARFRAHGLTDLAADAAFMAELARRTDPDFQPEGVLAPAARHATHSGLRDYRTVVVSSADIAAWVQETLLLHGPAGHAEDRQFWRETLT